MNLSHIDGPCLSQGPGEGPPIHGLSNALRVLVHPCAATWEAPVVVEGENLLTLTWNYNPPHQVAYRGHFPAPNAGPVGEVV